MGGSFRKMEVRMRSVPSSTLILEADSSLFERMLHLLSPIENLCSVGKTSHRAFSIPRCCLCG